MWTYTDNPNLLPMIGLLTLKTTMLNSMTKVWKFSTSPIKKKQYKFFKEVIKWL
jgi:hypothetical protein